VTPAGPGEGTLREVVETLAPLERRAGSEGERQAAEWIAARLTAAGCATRVEEEQFHDGYARVMSPLAGVSALAGLAALARPRLSGLAGATAAAAAVAIADDISNGPRVFRRASTTPKTTWNVVAPCGDPGAARTLVVLAHHDAAPTGRIFDDRAQRWAGERFPGILERIDTSLPLWWTVLAAPALVAVGAARRRRGLLAAGVAGSALGVATFEDIAGSPIVPGANDNLTAVAVLVALAELTAEQPLRGLRLLLVSCGAEEVIQGGIYGFAARHFPGLDRDRTWFLNLDTVGSPRLIMLEGEGPVVMEDYHDRSFRDLVAGAAERAGAPLLRGMRARNSTDAVLPSRAGYPTATLASMDRNKALSNYHLMSDTPENVCYRTVRQALTVTDAVARELAANPWIGA
jgi:Zn-dependent M28 family amino/carboxypeptidase